MMLSEVYFWADIIKRLEKPVTDRTNNTLLVFEDTDHGKMKL